MIRRFLIYYPLSNLYESREVNVLPGESPEDAILREGDATEGWILYRELPLD